MFKLAVLLGYVTSVLAIISGIFLQPILLHNFGDADYILWTNFIIVIGYFSNGFVGVQTFATMFISKSKSKLESIQILSDTKKTIVILSGLILVTLVLLKPINLHFDFELLSSNVFITCLFFVLFRISNESALSYYSGIQKPLIPKIYDFIIKLVSIILIGAICFFQLGLNKAILCFFLFQAIASIYLLFLKKESNIHSKKFNSKTFFNVAALSLPYLAVSIPQSFLQTVDTLILSKYLEPVEVASFIFYMKIFSIVLISQNIIMSIYSPRWARLLARNNIKMLNKSFYSINFILFCILFFVFLILNFYGSEIMFLWTKRQDLTLNSNELVLILALIGAYALRTNYYFLNNSIGINKNDVLICWIEGGAHILLSIYLVQIYGLVGCIVGSIFSCTIGIGYFQYKKATLLKTMLVDNYV